MAIRVALTFDTEHADRPNALEPDRLLSVLSAAGTRATFFLQGRWVESAPAKARSIFDAKHVVGSHGHYHCRMSQLTDDGIRNDVALAEGAIRENAGVDPRPWFRCPFGDGARNARVQAGLAGAGYRHVGWNVNPEDWREGVTTDELEQAVREGIDREGNGAVVLLHAWPAETPTVVERLLATAAEDGIDYVGIDELGVDPVKTVPW